MTPSAPSRPRLYTIGHSDHELSAFISLLAQHGVTAVADVRSQPYSRFHSQFNRELLADALKRSGIQYVFMGRELGARRAERESYQGRQARYDLIAKLPAFQEGLTRLRRGLEAHRIALLCAEKDPITCHRTVLVCKYLKSEPIDILHILDDGSVETTDQVEARLLEAVGLPPSDLFQSRQELVEQAYSKQAARIAFTEADAEQTQSEATS
jgi:uncharacterized protein (DUF488 family)